MDPRAVVERFVDAFGNGRLDDVVHAAGGVPYSGDYQGAAGFRDLITKISEVVDLTPSPEMQYLVDGDKVVLYYRLTFTARASTKSIEMRVAEVLSVRDGQIAELDVFYKDPSAVVALLTV